MVIVELFILISNTARRQPLRHQTRTKVQRELILPPAVHEEQPQLTQMLAVPVQKLHRIPLQPATPYFGDSLARVENHWQGDAERLRSVARVAGGHGQDIERRK